jgi:prepilin-type N-terminal cleavage/methylation domain-containing protein
MKSINNNGFTISEMSIVLAIIGLLAGSIVTFGAITANSKLIAIIKELQNYKSAIATFSAIYGNLPGDMDNATIIFGTTDANGNTMYNGNGDGIIGNRSGTLNGNQESPSTFQELGLSSLIQGQYTGILGNIPNGTNFPYSKYRSNSFYFIYSSNLWSNYQYFNSIILTGVNTSSTTNYVVAANDAYNIDLKIDDGIPLTGLIIAYNATAANNCTNNNINTTPSHKTTAYLPNNGTYCNLHMSLETYNFE